MRKGMGFVSKQGFLKGAFVLSIAAFISKLLGLFYVIPLKHFAGDEGLALYQLVFPMYNTILMLSISGVPIALSKLISESSQVNRTLEVTHIMSSAFRLMVLISISGFIVFYVGSSTIAQWIGQPDTQLSFQALAFAMLIVPFVAMFRGYFYGYQQMNFSALSQILEQLIRVSFMTSIVYILVRAGQDIAFVAAGAAFGSFVGLALSLIMLVYVYVYFRKKEDGYTLFKKSTASSRGYGWKILMLSLPASLSTLMIPLLGMVDSVSMINLLEFSGLTKAMATVEFGVYSRGVPLVQFSSFYATGLALSAVPALASATVLSEKREQIQKAIQISMLIGIPASLGLMIVAEPLNVLFYGDMHGSIALQVLSASTLFLSLAVMSSGVLQGLGKPIYPVIYLVIGLVVKVIGNVWFAPKWGIQGAAYATLLSYVVMAVLSIGVIHHLLEKKIGVKKYLIKWIAPSLWMAGILIGMLFFFPSLTIANNDRVQALFSVLILVFTGLVSYAVGLILFKTISWTDLKRKAEQWKKRIRGSRI